MDTNDSSSLATLPTLYDLKPAFQRCLRPAGRFLARRGVRPNSVTLAATAGSFGVGALSIWAATHEQLAVLWAVPAWMLVRMGLNAIDGMLAREHQKTTRLGALLNELTDPVSDAALILPLAFLPGVSPSVVVTLAMLAFCTELVGVAATTIGASRRYDGPMGKSDRAAAIAVFAGLAAAGLTLGMWANVYLALVSLLCAYTVVNRTRNALRETAEPTQAEGAQA